jgi:ABC-type multidrug transport system permease subunit
MNLNSYRTLIRSDIRLAFRQRVVIIFNFLMPLLFFFVFAQISHAERGGAILQIISMVLVIGILGTGLMGGGIRAAQDREANILRRYKVAPISALPLLVASTVTGLVMYMPIVVLMLFIATTRYHMAMPQHPAAMLIFVMLGVLATRAIGLIVASVVNSMQESAIIVQILYMSMLFLSGATFPTAMFPDWLLTVVQFIPATWIVTGVQGIMIRNETLAANWQAVGALSLTTALGLFLSVKLFRWEKEEKVRPSAKLWLLAVLVPFLILGGWQIHAKENVTKAKILARDLARQSSILIRNARIIVGNGAIIENGGVLVKAGKIAAVYDNNIPDPKTVDAEPFEGAGKTVLPGLIDVNVNAPTLRDLAAYLFCGVTAVNTLDTSPQVSKTRDLVNSGEKQGAELFQLKLPATISLSAAEAAGQYAAGKPDLINRSLVLQVGPPEFLANLRKAIAAVQQGNAPSPESWTALNNAQEKLLQAYRAHQTLVVGTGAGKPLVFVGPSVQHEIELWVTAGIPTQDALRAATLNAAKALHADERTGSLEKGKEATLLVVDGNPLENIKALDAVSFVVFKGEGVNRGRLLTDSRTRLGN